MSFKVGDKVRYKKVEFGQSGWNWEGFEGEVTDVTRHHITYIKCTKPSAEQKHDPKYIGQTFHLITKNLELVESTGKIRFKDIQEGDLIQRTVTEKDESTYVSTATAHHLSEAIFPGERWYSSGDWLVAKSEDDRNPNVTLELLDRAKPEPKLWEKAVVGESIVREDREEPNGELTVFTKIDKDKWVSVYLQNTHEGFDPTGTYFRTDENIDVLLSSAEKAGFKLTLTGNVR